MTLNPRRNTYRCLPAWLRRDQRLFAVPSVLSRYRRAAVAVAAAVYSGAVMTALDFPERNRSCPSSSAGDATAERRSEAR